MKASNQLIEDAVLQIAGQEIIPLVKYLKDKKNVSEFKLAEIMKTEVNTVRNMLYKLYEHNLVSFVRKKDKQKGWYIYYWTFEPKKVKYLMYSLKQKRIQRLKERLEREKQGIFYECPSKCIRLDFDQAFNFNFKCPECGQLINQEDNQQKIKEIEDEILMLETSLKDNIPQLKKTREISSKIKQKKKKKFFKKFVKKLKKKKR